RPPRPARDAQCRPRAPHRERHGADTLGDVGDGRPQHGDGRPRWPAAKPGQPRGQAIVGAGSGTTSPLALRYRLLALDLDGTILGLNLELDPRDVEAVNRLVAAGVAVVACTGRPFPGALPWVERLGLPGPIICYQGAQVRNLDGTVLLDHGIGHETAMEVIRFARQRKLHVQAYRDDRLIVEHDREEAHIYARHAGMQVNVVQDLDQAMGPTTPKL